MLSLAAVPADGCTGLAGHNIEGLKMSTSSYNFFLWCEQWPYDAILSHHVSNGKNLTFMYFEHDINLVVSFSYNVYLLILYSWWVESVIAIDKDYFSFLEKSWYAIQGQSNADSTTGIWLIWIPS